MASVGARVGAARHTDHAAFKLEYEQGRGYRIRTPAEARREIVDAGRRMAERGQQLRVIVLGRPGSGPIRFVCFVGAARRRPDSRAARR